MRRAKRMPVAAAAIDAEPEVRSAGDATYSQPLPETVQRSGTPEIVRAGFIGGKGSRTPGFILRKVGRQAGKPQEAEATAETKANTHPRGFFGALARLWGGSNR